MFVFKLPSLLPTSIIEAGKTDHFFQSLECHSSMRQKHESSYFMVWGRSRYGCLVLLPFFLSWMKMWCWTWAVILPPWIWGHENEDVMLDLGSHLATMNMRPWEWRCDVGPGQSSYHHEYEAIRLADMLSLTLLSCWTNNDRQFLQNSKEKLYLCPLL